MNGINHLNIVLNKSESFIYKANLLGKANVVDGNNRSLKNAKIVVPLNYLSNFFRSLETPLINSKIHLELNWNNNCVMYGADAGGNDNKATFKITSTNLYVPIALQSTKDNVNLTKQLNEGFKTSVYWNEYKPKVETKDLDNDSTTRFHLHTSFQGVNRLIVLDFNNTTQNVAGNPINNTANRVQRDSHRKYFLPRVDITNDNVLIDGSNFHDQPISDRIRKYDAYRKITTGKVDDYTTGCSLDYQCFKNNCS